MSRTRIPKQLFEYEAKGGRYLGDQRKGHDAAASSGREVRPINKMFRPQDYIRLVVSFMIVHVFFFFR
jgi:hypothetical protein